MKHLPCVPWNGLLAIVVVLCATFSVADPPTEQPKTDIWEDHLVYPFDLVVLTDRQIDRFLSRLSESNPARAADLEKIRITHPQQFRWEIRDEMASRFFGRTAPSDTVEPSPSIPADPPVGVEDAEQKRYRDLVVWLEQNFPQQAEELKANPAISESRVNELFRRYEPVMRTERNNPPLADAMKEDISVQMQCDALLLILPYVDEPARNRIIHRIDELTAKRFDLILLKRQLQHDQLQRRLERLSQELARQNEEIELLKSGKDLAVKDRVNELVKRADNADWD